MKEAAEKIHQSIAPLCSSKIQDFDLLRMAGDGEKGDNPQRDEYVEALWKRSDGLVSESGVKDKDFLVQEDKQRVERKDSFFSQKRGASITEDECRMILQRSFECIYTLLDSRSAHFEAQVKSHMIEPFKTKMTVCLMTFGISTDWNKVLCPDPSLATKIAEREKSIGEIEKSLQQAKALSAKF